MSIEQEIAGLTQSTTDLLDAVNTKKATLDTAVSNAQTAVTDATSQVSLAAAEKVGAQDARDEAETHKNLAYTYSQSAASAVAYQDLTAIAESKAETAVDVFVYDTRKDSDGGAWRKRTQGTSWYNEPLNTATRGSRKEFPAVAVIVAEANKVTIYDGDDPSLPMWMVFNQVSAPTAIYDFFRGSRTPSSLSALNGLVCFGTNVSGDTGLHKIDLIADDLSRISATSSWGGYGQIVSNRNVSMDLPSRVSIALVNATVNDVAMTVLPNAPIDPDTGLPIPTIAVATDGGVSVIKDDGTVVDKTIAIGGVEFIDFVDDNRLLITRRGLTYFVITDDLDSDSGSYLSTLSRGTLFRYNYTDTKPDPISESSLSSYIAVKDNENISLGFMDGLNLFNSSTDFIGVNHFATYITSTYNTGWMNGDIKLATLSDTDDTDLVGSELVTNGTFDTGTTGWTAVNGAALSVVSGTLKVEDTTGSFGYARQTFATEIGKTYTVSLDIVDASNSTINFAQVGSSVDADLYTNSSVGVVSNSSWSFTFTAQTTTSAVQVTGGLGIGKYTTYDNISVRLAEPDRSVNNNGLQVFGTVTREPVATGADLVGYSGFSSTNYLQQPYNSDLDFGTGDFCVMGWLRLGADTSNIQMIYSRYAIDSTNPDFSIRKNADVRLSFNGASGAEILVGDVLQEGLWTFATAYRKNGVVYLYQNGQLKMSASDAADYTNTSALVQLGNFAAGSLHFRGSLALWRVSATAPTAEQIAKIYRDEKPLFQEGAQATLHGTSDAVTALAYDTDTTLLHVGTSSGRSVFQGLRRVDNTTDAVGTAISASNNLVVEE